MKANNQPENLSWHDTAETKNTLEAVRTLAAELRTDYPTDTADEPTNWNNKARNRRNAILRSIFRADPASGTDIDGKTWLELFDLSGFCVDKETRKRFASHLNWYSFWYADFKPRLSHKYAQRIHWYIENFLFCILNKLQTEKDYREGKFGTPATLAEMPRISTGTAGTINVSVEEGQDETTLKTREELINYLEKTHGVEYDTEDVVYLQDGCVAEDHGEEWDIYPDEESDECIETIRAEYRTI